MQIGSLEITPVATHIGTFLIGVASGVIGKYYGDLFTDKRKQQESGAGRKKKWEDVKKKMPELIAEMKTDWSKSENALFRKFFILHEGQDTAIMEPALIYYHEIRENLDHKITILENHGFVQLVEVRGVIKGYQATEEFVEFLLK
jgi:hypothetical protein